MYTVLDLAGAFLCFILNIILFPLFVLVYGMIYCWILQKFLYDKLQKLAIKSRHSQESLHGRRGFAFFKNKTIEISH
jgi:uncharacterized membrane protein